MRSIIESLNNSREIENINEAREVEYRVSILDVVDGEELPVTVTMLCPKEFQKKFESWLEDQQDNAFAHADGGNIEY